MVDGVKRVESQARAEEALKQYLESGQFENAGLMLVRLGEHWRAAQAFWRCGQFKKAAECALRAGYYAQAGEAYTKAGEHLLAAKVFTRAKDMGRAAEAYEAAGSFQEASRMYLLTRNYTKAVELFQKATDLNPQLREASHTLAKAMWEQGGQVPVEEKVDDAPRATEPQEESLALRYQLALLHLERGSPFEAGKILREIVDNKPGFRDAKALLMRCEERLGLCETASPPGPAPADPPEATDASRWARRLRSLQETSLFQEFTLADIREVYASGRIVELPRDRVIIEAGETGRTLYILLEGLVKVTTGKDEAEEILALRLPGEHFGEMSLLEDAPTSANVVAAENSILFALERKSLEGVLAGTSPLALKFYRAFVKTLSQRLRKATAELAAAGKS